MMLRHITQSFLLRFGIIIFLSVYERNGIKAEMIVLMPLVKMGSDDDLIFIAPHFPCQLQADFMALAGRYLVWLEALAAVPCDISVCFLVLLFG